MSLLDHFRTPLSDRRQWRSFLHAWTTYIAFDLNARLPEGYFAEPNARFRIEPEPSAMISPTIMTDLVEVSIFADEGGPTLAGAIELVSPANKDRPATRDAFTSKCAVYLQAGVGLVVVDIVTDRKADLHAELMTRLFAPAVESAGELYSAAYRPTRHGDETRLDIWREPLALGGSLPVMPLWLKGGPCLPVDLGATYNKTRRKLRMGDGA